MALTSKQKTAYDAFNVAIEQLVASAPDFSIVASIADESTVARSIHCNDLKEALEITLATMLNILKDISTSQNAGLLTIILACLNKVDVEDKGINQDILHEINQLLAKSDSIKEITKTV